MLPRPPGRNHHATTATATTCLLLPPSPLARRWADIYKESGPDGLGAMGSEPSCELLLLQLQEVERRAASAAAETAASGGGGGGGGGLEVAQLQVLSCGAHRVLAAEARALDSASLGLTDDVDCAVVQLGLEPAGLAARHVASVPALAYIAAGECPRRAPARLAGPGWAPGCCVASRAAAGGSLTRRRRPPTRPPAAAGKVQRKHLLLGAPSSSIAAVLVEGQRYLYLYSATAASQSHGLQQVRRAACCGTCRCLPAHAACAPAATCRRRLPRRWWTWSWARRSGCWARGCCPAAPPRCCWCSRSGGCCATSWREGGGRGAAVSCRGAFVRGTIPAARA